METLKLNDGTVLNGHCIENGDLLWVYVYGITLTEAFTNLNDPEKTKKIVATRYGDEATVRGYKHLFCIREENGGMVSAGLKKG